MSDPTYADLRALGRMTRPLRYAVSAVICLHALLLLLALGEEAALRILAGFDVEYDAELVGDEEMDR